MPQDTIFYYTHVFPKLKNFLRGREIATITRFKDTTIVRRGSNHEPLFIDELITGVNRKFLDFRQGDTHLNDVRNQLTKNQVKIWEYFVPRKLIELHYAVNHEHPNKHLDRIYFDIDRKDIPAEKAQLVAYSLIKTIQEDNTFPVSSKIFPLWTGNSFHVYMLLKKKVPHSFYEKYIHTEHNQSQTFTSKWTKKIQEQLPNIPIVAGHEKQAGVINIDPSQSPSGKISRSPFSLYMKTYSSIHGTTLPLTIDDLKLKSLVSQLRAYTIEKVIKNIDTLAKKLPL